jgi:hypothetical protein
MRKEFQPPIRRKEDSAPPRNQSPKLQGVFTPTLGARYLPEGRRSTLKRALQRATFDGRERPSDELVPGPAPCCPKLVAEILDRLKRLIEKGIASLHRR